MGEVKINFSQRSLILYAPTDIYNLHIMYSLYVEEDLIRS
jgi:hypothetical protein